MTRTGPLPPRDTAYVAFVEVAWQRHFGLAMLLTGNRLQAEELLQDSLVKVYERWRKLAKHNEADAYLRRTMTNNHISGWRRRRREHLVADVPDRGYDPAEPQWSAELRAALRDLPPRQRAVVVLRHFEDLPEREIARLLGCTIGTVKSQNARALEKLRRALPTAGPLMAPESTGKW